MIQRASRLTFPFLLWRISVKQNLPLASNTENWPIFYLTG